MFEQLECAETHPSGKFLAGAEREHQRFMRGSDTWWLAWVLEAKVWLLVSHWLSLSLWMLSILHYS